MNDDGSNHLDKYFSLACLESITHACRDQYASSGYHVPVDLIHHRYALNSYKLTTDFLTVTNVPEQL